MYRIRRFLEWQVFGVCSAIGERVGISHAVIRRYFIYISFLTMGSPLIVYFFMAFWMNLRQYMSLYRRNPVGE